MIRILIVEDNEMNRDMLSRRLQRKGFEVLVAVDGRQGIDMVNSSMPDLVLMDLSLPEIDGWQAISRIKADPGLRHIPVIALTAHAMSGDRESALQAGADDFETKPINLEQLLAKMDVLVPRSGSELAIERR